MAAWAIRTRGVAAVVLIGSHAGDEADRGRTADVFSDWDFVVFTTDLPRFEDSRWVAALGLGEPAIYARRDGTVGSATRVTVVWPGAEADFVIVPAWPWRWRRWAFGLGMHRFSPRLTRSLADLAIVARPGYRFLYGARRWKAFYQRVLAEISDPRLDDRTIVRRAGVFAADYVWLQRKLARGEYVAAQRVLVRCLHETNLQFLHELKLRRGEPSFPEGRRFEQVASRADLELLRLGPLDWSRESLSAATEKARAAFIGLVRDLVGDRWNWPIA